MLVVLLILIMRTIVLGMVTVSEQNSNEFSLYQETCCAPSAKGQAFMFIEKTIRLFFCPFESEHLLCFRSCKDILAKNSNAKSGHYQIVSTNGALTEVYCDMEGLNCDGEGGWTRIGYLNMTAPGATCPSGL